MPQRLRYESLKIKHHTNLWLLYCNQECERPT